MQQGCHLPRRTGVGNIGVGPVGYNLLPVDIPFLSGACAINRCMYNVKNCLQPLEILPSICTTLELEMTPCNHLSCEQIKHNVARKVEAALGLVYAIERV